MDTDDFQLALAAILPVQVVDRLFRGAQLHPEKRLQLAVLVDAVATRVRVTSGTKPSAQTLLAEVDEWFASEVADGPFSFVAICDSLGFEPAYIRRGLRQLHTNDGTRVRRTMSLRHESGSRHRIVRPRVYRAA